MTGKRLFDHQVTTAALSPEEVHRRIDAGEFVCPMPRYWASFQLRLDKKLPKEVKIPNALILGAWACSNYAKNERLREHLSIAKENSLLDDALRMLSRIPEEEWLTSSGNLSSNEPHAWEIEEQNLLAAAKGWYFRSVEDDDQIQSKFEFDLDSFMFAGVHNGNIFFVTESGRVFDKLQYPDDQTAAEKLRKNGFIPCEEEEKLVSIYFRPDVIIPTIIDKNSRNPVYSAGEIWED